MLVEVPIAMIVPPSSTNALSAGIVVAAVIRPWRPWNSAGMFDCAPPPCPPRPPAAAGASGGAASPPPPRPPPAGSPGAAGIAPPGKISTSYFWRRLPASSAGGNTSSKLVGYACSKIHRIQPDGIEPPYWSHSPMRTGFSFSALPLGFTDVASKATPRSAASFSTKALVVFFAGT